VRESTSEELEGHPRSDLVRDVNGGAHQSRTRQAGRSAKGGPSGTSLPGSGKKPPPAGCVREPQGHAAEALRSPNDLVKHNDGVRHPIQSQRIQV
jgi:hypothetical protein